MFKLRNILLLATAFVMLMALGTPLVASSDLEEVDNSPAAPLVGGAGSEDQASQEGFTPSGDEIDGTITVSGSTYDQTTLSKFIPGTAFVPDSDLGDSVDYNSNSACITPSSASVGALTEAYAPVELPNGALLLSVSFYGSDTNVSNMSFRVSRGLVRTPGFFSGTAALTESLIVSGNSSALSGIGGVFLDVNPDLATGSTGSFITGITNNFFTLKWTAANAAGVQHKLCGARVLYKVPTTGSNQVFTPLAPCAIFDSRPGQGGTGPFTANESRNITVTGDTSAIGGDGDCGINSAATAVQVNILILSPAGTGTFKAWQQGGSETAGLVAFTNEISRWNGSSTIPIAANDQMTMKMQNSGSDVRLIVTGYYSSVSNMGN